MKRREFIRTSAIVAPAISLFPADLSFIEREFLAGKLEKRSLGRTGEKLSIIGFGGIIVMDATPEYASGMVKKAIEAGVNYFDVAPSYGNAEEKLGPALQPYRNNVFLSCKTQKRDKDGSRKELEQSLKNMRTDHFDLYQFHAVTTMDDVKKILGKDGALETFREAKKEGKIRFMGFSAHSVEAALALMDSFNFDTIMFPFNYTNWYAGNFGPQVLDTAHKKGMGIIALKAMAKGPWPKGAPRTNKKTWYEPLQNKEDILTGLRFTLSHPVTTAITPGDGDLFSMALDVRDDIKPLGRDEVESIKLKAQKGTPLFKYPTANV